MEHGSGADHMAPRDNGENRNKIDSSGDIRIIYVNRWRFLRCVIACGWNDRRVDMVWTDEDRRAFQAIRDKNWDVVQELAEKGNVIASTMWKTLTKCLGENINDIYLDIITSEGDENERN